MKIGEIIDDDEFYQFMHININKKPLNPNYPSPVGFRFAITDDKDITNCIATRRSYIKYEDIQEIEFDALKIENKFDFSSIDSLDPIPTLNIQLDMRDMLMIPHAIQYSNPIQVDKRENFNFQRIFNKTLLLIDVNLIVCMRFGFKKASAYSAIAHFDYDTTILSYKELRNRLKKVNIEHISSITIAHDGFAPRSIIQLDGFGSEQFEGKDDKNNARNESKISRLYRYYAGGDNSLYETPQK